eukprot:15184286-Alexandrium_andersonii.AAC.1
MAAVVRLSPQWAAPLGPLLGTHFVLTCECLLNCAPAPFGTFQRSLTVLSVVLFLGRPPRVNNGV